VSITGHKKTKETIDNVKIGNLKKNRNHKKYLNKMKILVTITFKIPILTVVVLKTVNSVKML